MPGCSELNLPFISFWALSGKGKPRSPRFVNPCPMGSTPIGRRRPAAAMHPLCGPSVTMMADAKTLVHAGGVPAVCPPLTRGVSGTYPWCSHHNPYGAGWTERVVLPEFVCLAGRYQRSREKENPMARRQLGISPGPVRSTQHDTFPRIQIGVPQQEVLQGCHLVSRRRRGPELRRVDPTQDLPPRLIGIGRMGMGIHVGRTNRPTSIEPLQAGWERAGLQPRRR